MFSHATRVEDPIDLELIGGSHRKTSQKTTAITYFCCFRIDHAYIHRVRPTSGLEFYMDTSSVLHYLSSGISRVLTNHRSDLARIEIEGHHEPQDFYAPAQNAQAPINQFAPRLRPPIGPAISSERNGGRASRAAQMGFPRLRYRLSRHPDHSRMMTQFGQVMSDRMIYDQYLMSAPRDRTTHGLYTTFEYTNLHKDIISNFEASLIRAIDSISQNSGISHVCASLSDFLSVASWWDRWVDGVASSRGNKLQILPGNHVAAAKAKPLYMLVGIEFDIFPWGPIVQQYVNSISGSTQQEEDHLDPLLAYLKDRARRLRRIPKFGDEQIALAQEAHRLEAMADEFDRRRFAEDEAEEGFSPQDGAGGGGGRSDDDPIAVMLAMQVQQARLNVAQQQADFTRNLRNYY